MRGSRLVNLLLILQARRRCTARELAEQLKVSERTIYRDLDALCAAGVPVYGVAGPGGGYALVEGYQTKLTGLTAPEAEALLVFDPSSVAEALGMKEPLLAARLKLVAALPPGLRDRARSVSGWVHLDLAGWFEEAELPASLSVVASAVINKRMVRFRYGTPPNDKDRVVDPFGLVLKGRSWYLVAAQGDRQLSYAVGRIHDPVVTDETSRRPAGFDLATTWAMLVADFEMGLPAYKVSVRVAEGALSNLRRAVDRRTREETEWEHVEARGGWVTLEVAFEHLNHARHELLALGASVEVLTPTDLRLAIADEIRTLAALYTVR